MKNIKQIREEFNNIEGPIVEDHEFSMARSELKSIIDNAQHLLGLLKGEGDLEAWMQSKITKAADYLTSVHDNISSGESDIKEDHDEKEAEKASFDKKIPFMIMLRRRSIRQFPNNQTVALYYAQSIDRYISIPFGRKAEAVIAETLKFKSEKEYQDWLKQTGKSKKIQEPADDPTTDAPTSIIKKQAQQPQTQFDQKSHDDILNKLIHHYSTVDTNKETPEQAGQRAAWHKTLSMHQKAYGQKSGVTPEEHAASIASSNKKIELAKQAGEDARAKSFTGGLNHLSTLPGMSPGNLALAAGAYTLTKGAMGLGKLAGKGIMAGAKKAGIMKEEKASARLMFEMKLKQKRELNEDDDGPTIKSLLPGYDAYQSYKKGDYWGAAGNLALDAATVATGGLAGAALKGAAYGVKALKTGRTLGQAARLAQRGASSSTGWKVAKGIGKTAGGALGLGSAAASALGGGGTDSESGKDSSEKYQLPKIEFDGVKPKSSSSFSGQLTQGGAQIGQEKRIAKQVYGGFNEGKNNSNVIDQLKEIATKTDLTKDILFVNEEQVDINSNIAKKVIKVYEALNEENKAKFAKMLGKSKTSFQKAVKFALRYK